MVIYILRSYPLEVLPVTSCCPTPEAPAVSIETPLQPISRRMMPCWQPGLVSCQRDPRL